MRAQHFAMTTAILTVGAMGVFSLWTPWLKPQYLDRWFGFPTLIFSVIVPVLVLACLWLIFKGLRDNQDWLPFVASLALFTLGFAGIGISFYPYMVPTALTIWDAAAPEASLKFLLVGAVVLVPIILLYTGYAYWVFRGKINPEEGYH
jgi:cytochrome d ubiquinol oxidase subunit II